MFCHPLTPPAFCHDLGSRGKVPVGGLDCRDEVSKCLSVLIKLIINKVVQILSFKLFFVKFKLKNMAIVNPLQLEAARATPALSGFNLQWRREGGAR